MKKLLLATLLCSPALALAAKGTAPPEGAAAVQQELTLRDECRDLATNLVLGFQAARQGQASPAGEAAQAGYELPADTDIAAQATRLRRQCLKQSAGASEPTWAAVELMSHSRVLRQAAFRCLSAGFTYTSDTSEALLELAGCHSPEYPGLPAVVGGGSWTLRQAETADGLALELIGDISGPESGRVCTLINDFRKSKEDPSCQVRDTYSRVTSRFPLATAKDQSEMVNDLIKKMVEDYKKQHPELTTAP